MSNPGALTVRVHRETVVYPPSEEIQSHSFPYNGHIVSLLYPQLLSQLIR